MNKFDAAKIRVKENTRYRQKYLVYTGKSTGVIPVILPALYRKAGDMGGWGLRE